MNELYLLCPHCHATSYTGILGPGFINTNNSKARCRSCDEWIEFSTEDLFYEDGTRASRG